MSYHVEKFTTAVSVMAGDGHIKQRLVKAYEDNLQEIDADDLPASARGQFADLKSRMQSVAPLNGEGAIRATVRKMSVNDAASCGQLMVTLLCDVLRHSDSQQRRLPLHTDPLHVAPSNVDRLRADENPVVPPFLVKSG